jgi:hypothetical protein
MTQQDNYNIIVQQSEDSDDLFFEIPEEVLERLGWGEDTEVEFTVIDDEGFMLKKVES